MPWLAPTSRSRARDASRVSSAEVSSAEDRDTAPGAEARGRGAAAAHATLAASACATNVRVVASRSMPSRCRISGKTDGAQRRACETFEIARVRGC